MDPQLAIKISVILYWSALLIYTSYWVVGFMGRGVRFYVLLGGVVLHTVSITFRGISIEYFPLTNKFESFTGFALACFSVLLFYSRVESYVYRISTFCVGYCFFCCSVGLLFNEAIIRTSTDVDDMVCPSRSHFLLLLRVVDKFVCGGNGEIFFRRR